MAAQETSREIAFCTHAIAQTNPTDIFVVPDAAQDIRFSSNPLVTGHPDIRFYAGAQLVLGGEEGERLGTLCVIDVKPREITDTQRFILNSLVKKNDKDMKKGIYAGLIWNTYSAPHQYMHHLGSTSGHSYELSQDVSTLLRQVKNKTYKKTSISRNTILISLFLSIRTRTVLQFLVRILTNWYLQDGFRGKLGIHEPQMHRNLRQVC